MFVPKRGRAEDTEVFDAHESSVPVMAESLRLGESRPPEKKDDEKISLFWRVFGGTFLSICALVAATLYNSLTSNISELRAEVNRLNEARVDLVKKDEFNGRMTTSYDRIQGLQTQNNAQNATSLSYRTEFDALKDKLNRHSTELDAIKKETVAVESLKEKVSAATADLKLVAAEAGKVRQDVERNQAADQERKTRRDEQYRDFEKAMKELQASLLECQVKLARMEGQAAKPASAGRATPKKLVEPEAEKIAPPKALEIEKKD